MQQGRDADRSLPPQAEVKSGGAIPQLPIRLHSVVFNEVSIGICRLETRYAMDS
jgi:hypothetical protein